MSASRQSADASHRYLTLEIQHPDCWALDVTATRPGAFEARHFSHSDGRTTARLTAYGQNRHDVDRLLDATSAHRRTRSVVRRPRRHPFETDTVNWGAHSQDLLVEYDTAHSIGKSLVDNGLVPDVPVCIVDGTEYWPLFVPARTSNVEDALERVRGDEDASITILDGVDSRVEEATTTSRSQLTTRQREAFETARDCGYYEWPRDVTTRELAETLEISKTTLLEHLRTAESVLLGAP